MSARAVVRQSEIARALRAVKDAGGGFRVIVDKGAIAFLPSDDQGPLSEADEIERRMQEAFGK